jgi:hypothetical protein
VRAVVRGLIASLACAFVSCEGTTGYDLVTFYAAGVGPKDASKGQPYVFASEGFTVTLTQATLHVGAVYLDQSVPSSGGGPEPCTLPGTYVGEVRGGVDIDLTSPELQGSSVTGDGSTIPAAVGQVWLTGDGDVNDPSDQTPILAIAGTAVKGGASYPFSGKFVIDSSCFPAPPSTTLPGASPICLTRIVTPILTRVALAQSGTLVLRVDPNALFLGVDFSQLPKLGSSPASYAFSGCAGSDVPSIALFTNLIGIAPYSFEWQPAARQ